MNKKLILVVEDDPHLSKFVKKRLVDSGIYDVINAYNGQEAWDFMSKDPKANDLDCIILDYKMPIMDGPQFLDKLRHSDLANSKIGVVVLTAYEDKEKWYAATYTQGRVLAYLKKDQMETDLLPILQRVFEGDTVAMSHETDDLAMSKVKDIVFEEFQKKRSEEMALNPENFLDIDDDEINEEDSKAF